MCILWIYPPLAPKKHYLHTIEMATPRKPQINGHRNALTGVVQCINMAERVFVIPLFHCVRLSLNCTFNSHLYICIIVVGGRGRFWRILAYNILCIYMFARIFVNIFALLFVVY